MSSSLQPNPSPARPKVLITVLTTYERHGWPTKAIAEWFDYLRMRGADLPYVTRIVFADNFVPAAAARNHVSKVFLENSDAEWLMMIDNDMAPPHTILDCLIGAPEEADVIVPRFWIWDGGVGAPVLAWGVLSEDPKQPEVNALFVSKGFVELRKCGTGCIFIRRSALEKIAKPYFWYPANEDGGYTATEDIMFCEKLRTAGGRIFGNGDFEVGHFHNIDISKVAQAVYYRPSSLCPDGEKPNAVDTKGKIVPEAEESPSYASVTAASPA